MGGGRLWHPCVPSVIIAILTVVMTVLYLRFRCYKGKDKNMTKGHIHLMLQKICVLKECSNETERTLSDHVTYSQNSGLPSPCNNN